MPKVHSHYENLKVARDAPPEVIRAAYRSLSQMYHPDRNPGNLDATRIMAILNVAFETLSNPDKRRQHNQWIAEQEAIGAESQQQRHDTGRGRAFTVDDEDPHETTESGSSASGAGQDYAREVRDPRVSFVQKAQDIMFRMPFDWVAYGIAAFVIILIGVVDHNTKTTPPNLQPYLDEPTPAPGLQPFPNQPTPTRISPTSEYVRPRTAPNGEPWPTSPGYIAGYKRLNSTGLSSVTVDNGQNDSDVIVKLFSLNSPNARPVRTFYIPAGGRFSLGQVTAGNYDIRYRDLETGRLSRSEAFVLEETPTHNGTEYSNIHMTLYKVRDGNMQIFSMAESEF